MNVITSIFIVLCFSGLVYSSVRASSQEPLWTSDSDFPTHGQFYARQVCNTAVMHIAGRVFRSDIDSVYVAVTKNNQPYKRFALRLRAMRPQAQTVPDSGMGKRFDFRCPIFAECSVYGFTLGFKQRDTKWQGGTKQQLGINRRLWDSVVAVRDSIVCGDVLLLNGQSNIVLGAPVSPPDPFGRTFTDTSGSIVPTGINAMMRDFVWTQTAEVYVKGYPIGGIAFRLQEQLRTQQKIPICVINGGVGATAIEKHLPDSTSADNPATIYGNLLKRVQCADLQTSVKVLVWYQGESNSSAEDYLKHFRTLYQTWMRDYPQLQKVYAVQVHSSNCLPLQHDELKEAQRKLQEMFPKLEVVSSNAIAYHSGCHFTDSGYVALADRIYALMARDFYHSTDTLHLSSPSVAKAFWLDSSQRQICLKFTPKGNTFLITPDTTINGRLCTIADAFLLGSQSGYIASVQPFGLDSLVLTLKNGMPPIDRISYVSQSFYPATEIVYQGPWIVNKRGVGILSFHNMPIEQSAPK